MSITLDMKCFDGIYNLGGGNAPGNTAMCQQRQERGRLLASKHRCKCLTHWLDRKDTHNVF